LFFNRFSLKKIPVNDRGKNRYADDCKKISPIPHLCQSVLFIIFYHGVAAGSGGCAPAAALTCVKP